MCDHDVSTHEKDETEVKVKEGIDQGTVDAARHPVFPDRWRQGLAGAAPQVAIQGTSLASGGGRVGAPRRA